MTIVKWNNRPAFPGLFDTFLNREFEKNSSCGCSPATNVKESNEEFVIEMMVPGMAKDNFQVKLEKDILTVSSELKEQEDENISYSRREFGVNPFSRSFIIPKTVDTEKIVADYRDGILRLALPKKEEERTSLIREIHIN